MYLLYSLLLVVLFVAMLPYFLYQGIRHGKYLSTFWERTGRLPTFPGLKDRPVIWLHAVSVGEFMASRPLISRLKSELPGHAIAVSTTTQTGQQLARSYAGARIDAVFYFPFDLRRSVRRALDKIRPVAVVIMETELWPNFLAECRRREIGTVLVNGRFSTRSFEGYRRFRRVFAPVIRNVSLLLMQSETDAERARSLGAEPSRVRVCGNLKFDVTAVEGKTVGLIDKDLKSPDRSEATLSDELDNHFGLSDSEHLIVAGSTAAGEERILIKSFARVRRRPGLEQSRLIVAPRHPERFSEAARLLSRSGFRFARRSGLPGAAGVINDRRDAEILLLDSIGELAGVYRFANVVFIGGSLVDRGGHNIIEAAVHAKPIVVGPYTGNFRAIIADFRRSNAITQLSDGGDFSEKLASEFIRLLENKVEARAMGQRALQILLENKGATERTVNAIKLLIRT